MKLILVRIFTSSRVPSCPHLSNAASRRVPSRWAVDAESGTLVPGPRWGAVAKALRQEAAGGGTQWLGGGGGGRLGGRGAV